MSVACSHRPPCPGCPRFGESSPDPAKIARLRAFCAEHGAPEPRVVGGEATGHRHRARLAVRGRPTSPKIGLFQEGSHRIVDIPSCPIHHRAINEAVAAVKRAVRLSGTRPYLEGPHAGLLRYLQLVVERSSGKVQVTLVVNGDDDEGARPLLDAVADALGDSLQGLWLNFNSDRGNSILGSSWSHVAGADAVIESIGGAAVYFHPGAFGQSNLPVADELVTHVHGLVPQGASVAELFAGCGAIGLGLLARGHEVRFNEISPYGVEGLRRGLERLQRSAVIDQGPAEDSRILSGADVVIVDPPRKGMGGRLVEALGRHDGPILAVYCGFESFVEEVGRLLEGGRRLRSVAAFDCFPYTRHIEVTAELG